MDPNAPRWTDPYWNRQCFLYNGNYWWIGPDGRWYLYTANGYYWYNWGDNGVVVVPDPTVPVNPPPYTPAPAGQTMVYSTDGTRSVQVTGDNRDAYLYDLTVADPNSDAAQGKFIGTQVAGVNIDYVTTTNPDGTTTQAIEQIELSYDDATALTVVDINGQRRVDTSGDATSAAQSLSLINLVDSTVDPVSLASGLTASSTVMSYQQTTDANGNSVQTLSSIALTVTDGSGNQSTLTFDQDGNATQTLQVVPPPVAPAPPAPQMLLQRSGAFQSLQNGISW
jgi:hypothetical protein